MIGFCRVWMGLLAVCLLLVSGIRLTRPAESTASYLMVYGDLPTHECCGMYALNPRTQYINRVQLAIMPQLPNTDDHSASGLWRYATVDTNRDLVGYLIPQDGRPPLRLPNQVKQGWYFQWAESQDELYYMAWDDGLNSALYRIIPPNTTPQRLSAPLFSGVRAIQEQTLPPSEHFTPWVIGFLAANLLFIALRWRPVSKTSEFP